MEHLTNFHSDAKLNPLKNQRFPSSSRRGGAAARLMQTKFNFHWPMRNNNNNSRNEFRYLLKMSILINVVRSREATRAVIER